MPPNAQDRPPRYHIFILSLWEQGGGYVGEGTTWRFSLEHSQTAQRRGFKSLEELTTFLEVWMQEPCTGTLPSQADQQGRELPQSD